MFFGEDAFDVRRPPTCLAALTQLVRHSNSYPGSFDTLRDVNSGVVHLPPQQISRKAKEAERLHWLPGIEDGQNPSVGRLSVPSWIGFHLSQLDAQRISSIIT